jgi:DNA-directed RNA polymerase subunit RPC12/RpoP
MGNSGAALVHALASTTNKKVKEKKWEFDYQTNEYVCLKCQRRIREQYGYSLKNPWRTCGTKQLMRLWSWHNFVRHLKACWKIKEIVRVDEKRA